MSYIELLTHPQWPNRSALRFRLFVAAKATLHLLAAILLIVGLATPQYSMNTTNELVISGMVIFRIKIESYITLFAIETNGRSVPMSDNNCADMKNTLNAVVAMIIIALITQVASIGAALTTQLAYYDLNSAERQSMIQLGAFAGNALGLVTSFVAWVILFAFHGSTYCNSNFSLSDADYQISTGPPVLVVSTILIVLAMTAFTVGVRYLPASAFAVDTEAGALKSIFETELMQRDTVPPPHQQQRAQDDMLL